ncbi:MAG: hypothetical protein WA496_12890 [Candidatus Udaeobacter sp.]
MRAGARYLIVAIAICSWIAISNHCAFVTLATKTDSAQATCPFHSTQKQQSAQVQCCKILRAIVLAKTKTWARNDARFSAVDLRVEEFALIALLPCAQASSSLDTGPPDAHSFAELILQRSLFAHAPPFRA